MIQAKNLRVGNLVQTEYEGIIEIVNINSEGFDYIDFKKRGFKAIGRIELAYVDGIVLTEEILIRFGFNQSVEKDKYYLSANFKNLAISTADNKIRLIIGNFVCQLAIAELEFVHTFQNAIFALTQTELTLKDNV